MRRDLEKCCIRTRYISLQSEVSHLATIISHATQLWCARYLIYQVQLSYSNILKIEILKNIACLHSGHLVSIQCNFECIMNLYYPHTFFFLHVEIKFRIWQNVCVEVQFDFCILKYTLSALSIYLPRIYQDFSPPCNRFSEIIPMMLGLN